MNGFFFSLTIVLILAGLVSFLVSLLKQPTIIAYILTGLIISYFNYSLIQQSEIFNALGQIGITLLLFMVGLQLDLGQLKRVGRAAILSGIFQVLVTTLLGFCILIFLGFSSAAAGYIAPALTFSSTIIVVKLLSEKKDLQSLYGKLVVGIFLTQDFIAILILICLSSFSPSAGTIYSGLPIWQNVLMTISRGLILALVVWWLSAKIFPKILDYIGNNEELMLVFSLAWALGLAAFVSLPFVGFSLEIGGFLAGLSLGRSGVHYEISGKIKPLRDFFLILFFIVLGMGFTFTGLSGIGRPAILLSLFVLIGNPIIVMFILGAQGFKPRTGFFTGVTVAQISEFSLILVALGYQLGHLQKSDVALVTLVAIITIALSSYLIKYSAQIYDFIKPILQFFDFRKGFAEKHAHTVALKNHIILVGAHRLGHHLVDGLIKQKTPFVVVDFNPEVVEGFADKGVLAICGDIADEFVQEQANLPYAKLIVSTVPDIEDNMSLIHAIHRQTEGKTKKPKLIFIAQDEAETHLLYKHGIDYVISPHFMGGIHLAKILGDRNGMKSLAKLKEHHLSILKV